MNQVHICPVCNGNGLVPNGFYTQTSGYWSSTDATPEKCKGCNGMGWITLLDDDRNKLLKAIKQLIEELKE